MYIGLDLRYVHWPVSKCVRGEVRHKSDLASKLSDEAAANRFSRQSQADVPQSKLNLSQDNSHFNITLSALKDGLSFMLLKIVKNWIEQSV